MKSRAANKLARGEDMLMESAKSDFLRPVDLGAALRLSRSKIYEALQRGDIPSIKIAGVTRVPRSWVDQKVREALAACGEGERTEQRVTDDGC
jgi:hypothetical protein